MVLGHFIQIQDQPAPTGTVQENQPFQIYYSAVNTAAGATPSQGHKDYIAVVDDPNDRNVFEHWHEQSQVGGNSGYGVTLDIPGLPAGDYLISVSLCPDENGEPHGQGSGRFTIGGGANP